MNVQTQVSSDDAPKILPVYLKVWFGLDLVLALLPPLHWWVNGPALIDGTAPRVLVYLFGTSAVIAASIVAAVLDDASTATGNSR